MATPRLGPRRVMMEAQQSFMGAAGLQLEHRAHCPFSTLLIVSLLH